MGCDIHMTCQINDSNGNWKDLFISFEDRNYGLFGFLVGVRNYSFIPILDKPRGYPKGFEHDKEDLDRHTPSWFTLKELLDFNYDQTFEDRRCCKTIGNYTDGATDSGKGNGVIKTYREFLGDRWFMFLDDLKRMTKNPEDIRIVFDFDN